MPKKPNKKTLRTKLDKIWSEIIRSKGQCEMCHKIGTNAHHIIGRRNLHLRWDLRNGCLLCSYCHIFSKNSAHQNPVNFMDFLDATRPEDINYLRKEQQVIEDNFAYEDCYIALNSQLEELKKLKIN